jgi:predicted PilT family ATPase
MGKKVYTINDNLYVIDDDTGKIKTVQIKDEPIPQRDMDEIIKVLINEAKKTQTSEE